jgi:hypothetical protein
VRTVSAVLCAAQSREPRGVNAIDVGGANGKQQNRPTIAADR